jgi:ABC-type transport system involved in multi-copper enzyme maturation permease subunit
MLLSLISKEVVHNVLSLRFMVTFVLFFVLTMVSIFTMTRAYERAQRTHEASASMHRELLTDMQGAEDQDDQFHGLLFGGGGIYGDRSPQPLGVFVSGLESQLPSQVNVTLWQARKVEERRYENPLFRLFETPDYAYIVNIVISLLALLFVFDAICGEKERGTLKVLLSNSVPRDLVLLGKWIGGYLSLAVPLLAALLGGITYVSLAGTVQLTDDFLARLGWIVSVSLLYVSVFFALGMMISTLTHKASTALLVSLFVWICWILVIPNLAPVIAKIVSPVPTLQKINAEKAAVDRETNIRTQRVRRNMLGYGKKAEQMQEEIDKEGEDRKEKIDQFYEDVLQDQIDWSRNLARISPSGSFLFATTDLAGTGVGLFTAFRLGYRRFGDEFSEWGWEWDVAFHDNDEQHPDSGWFQLESIPSLRLLEARLDDTVEAALMDILLLLVFNVLFFMLSYMFFLRYDVT